MTTPSTETDSGFSLIELLIYSALSIIVLVMVGGILINATSAERTVRTASASTTAAQVASESITNGVRNSTNIQVSVPSAGTQLLRTRSVGSAATAVWKCQAWYFGAGEIRTKTSSAAIATPTPEQALTWTLLTSVRAVDSTTPVFTATGKRVDFDFAALNGNAPAILISSSAVSRQPTPAGPENPICF